MKKTGDYCVRCEKKVFMNEKVTAHSKIFHETCFKCELCKTKLALGKSCDTKDGKVLCKSCYGSTEGPKVLGFGGNTGESGTGLDVTKGSQIDKEEKKETKLGLDDLEKLAKLKEKGLITEEEFNKKKKQILGL
jgi:hypothetical protein